MSTVTSTSASSRRIGEQIRYWLPAVVVFGLGIAAWQWLLPDVLGVEEFLLPRFSDVVQALVDERDKLLRGAWITFKEAFGGFVLGSGAAIVAALVLARWRPFGNALMPYMIAANAIPIIAFAPITNNWFGLLNPFSKMAIAAVLCFFPVMVNTLRGLGRALMPFAIAANAVPIIAFAPITNQWFGVLNPLSKMAIAAVLCFFPVLTNMLRGLTSVHPSSIELMRSYAAGNVEVFRQVRIPTSLPFMFTGLKVAAVLSMIGAIVGEYFGGPTNALGVSILNDTQLFNFPRAWAGIALASAFGIAFYAAVAFVERLTTSWHPSSRGLRGE